MRFPVVPVGVETNDLRTVTGIDVIPDGTVLPLMWRRLPDVPPESLPMTITTDPETGWLWGAADVPEHAPRGVGADLSVERMEWNEDTGAATITSCRLLAATLIDDPAWAVCRVPSIFDFPPFPRGGIHYDLPDGFAARTDPEGDTP